MAYKVVIAQSAIEDLQEIVSYIAQDDPQVAIRVGKKLIDHALTLEAFPERCPLFDTAQGIRKTVAAPYLRRSFTRRALSVVVMPASEAYRAMSTVKKIRFF